jgi:predicted enzyme related to lactoylglutathione lyase
MIFGVQESTHAKHHADDYRGNITRDGGVPRSKKPEVGSGRVAWFDLTTSNLAQSKEFYGKLFDWKFTAVQGTDLAAEIVSRDTSIGTIRVAEGKISPFNGVVYIEVTDIEASCKKAKELGGTVVPGLPICEP